MARRKLLLPVMAIVEVALLVALVCTAPGKVGSLEPESRFTGPQEDKVIAYYFHNTIRCATCMRIESYSQHAVEAGFRQELKNGKLEWRVVNMQSPENRHFIKDFDLHTSSLVIVRFRNGKQLEWRNLEKVWELVGNLSDFMRYVQHQVKGYLDAR